MSTPQGTTATPQSLRDMAQDWVDTLSLKRQPRVVIVKQTEVKS